MAGSSLSPREVTMRLAVVTASERRLPASSTVDELQPPIAEWTSLKDVNCPIQTGYGQKTRSTHSKKSFRTIKMRTTCTMCYNQFKDLVNSIGANCRGERSIMSNVVIGSLMRHRHATSVTKGNFPHGICFKIFGTFPQKRKKSTIFLKHLHDLVLVVPNHRVFHASSNPLGVQPMHHAPKWISCSYIVQA